MEQAELAKFLFDFLTTAAALGAVATAASLGATEYAKKINLSTRWAGIFSMVFSLAICFLICGILTKTYFSPIGIATSLVAVFAPSSIYSVIAALKKPKE